MARFKKLIESYKYNYQNSYIYKLWTWLFIILFSALLTYLLEYFVFTSGRFESERITEKDIEIAYSGMDFNEDTGVYTITSATAVLAFEFPEAYVYKISFHAKSEKNDLVKYEAISEDAYPVRNVDLYDYFDDSDETIVIDEVTNRVSLYLRDATGVRFTISKVKLDYSIFLNPIRMGCTFIVLLLGFYTLLTLTGFNKFKYERLALVYILVFGLMVSYLTPPRYTYDEFSHLVRSYNISMGNFNTEYDEEEDYPAGFNNLNIYDFRSIEEYEDILDYYEDVKGETEEQEIITAASSYLPINYVFSGIGIFIARIFNVSLYFYPFFGRMGNVIFYAFMIFLALKKFTINKPLMFFMATIPLMLSVAASNGTGVIQNACLFLAIALLGYCLTQERKINILEYLGLLFLFIMVIIARMPSGFFGLLLLIIPNKKFNSKFLRIFNKIITIVVIAVAMILVFRYTNAIGLGLNNIEGVDFDDQLALIIKNPLRFVERLWKYTTTGYLNTSVLQDIGYIVYTGRLAGLYTFLASILMIILAFTGNPDKQIVLDNLWAKILCIVTFMLTVASTEATLYLTFTPVNSYTVDGFQTRYFISTLLVPLLALQGRNLYMVHRKKTIEVLTTGMIFILLMLYVGTLVTKFYR